MSRPPASPLLETATGGAPLRLILVPDRGAPAGRTQLVQPEHARDLLRHAVTDHLRKLADPRLDHVSIFIAAGQVTDATGHPLIRRDPLPAGRDTVLDMLSAIPTYRVGVGAPADLPRSVAAAGRLVEVIAA